MEIEHVATDVTGGGVRATEEMMASPHRAREVDIDELYARHREPVLRWFLRRAGDPETALDLWAETFAQALASRGRFRGESEGELAGWLYGIAKHQLWVYHRRGRAEQRALQRLGLQRPAADSTLLEEIEQRVGLQMLHSELSAALAELSQPVRVAVELRVVRELPCPELANRLGISEPAARARVSRGLSTLADALELSHTKEAHAL
jgi:RNA polymerase sigma-70 factor (ECF subfamily)